MSYKKQDLLTLHEHRSVIPCFLVGSARVLLIFLIVFFSVVILCVWTFWVQCCDVRYDFGMKRCSFPLYLQLFVGVLMSCLYLRYLCSFVYSDVQHTLYCVVVLFFFVLLPVFWIVHLWLPHRYSLTFIKIVEYRNWIMKWTRIIWY